MAKQKKAKHVLVQVKDLSDEELDKALDAALDALLGPDAEEGKKEGQPKEEKTSNEKTKLGR